MPTMAEVSLMCQAHEYWDIGEYVPLDLFAAMASEGMDVPALEARFIQN